MSEQDSVPGRERREQLVNPAVGVVDQEKSVNDSKTTDKE